jgi:predicted transcriptional regulator
MNKAILLSVRPEHALNILEGKKTLELRKSVPKDFAGWVYVYVTKGKRLSVVHDDENGKTYFYLNSNWGRELNQDITCRFWFDDYDDVSTKYRIDTNQVERVMEQACISYDDFDKYVGDIENIYAWHIKNLEIFLEVKNIEDYNLKRAPQSWCYINE